MRNRTPFAFAAAAILISGLTVMHQAAAQQAGEIVVTSPRMIHRESAGRSPSGMAMEEVSLTRRVSYADLDLRRAADSNELDRRINVTAKEACGQLDTLYPQSTYPVASTDRDCFKEAVRDAMDQKTAIVMHH